MSRWTEPEARPETWVPACDVVVHATRCAYSAASGRNSAQSSACCTIQRDGGRVVLRRIDLCSEDEEWLSSCLGHELTHLVVADVFGQDRAPAWADEGMAVLSESTRRQALLLRQLQSILAAGRTVPLRELVELSGDGSMKPGPATHGESWLVVRVLIQRSGPQQFVRFVRQTQNRGFDRALRDVYAIDGIEELETLWRTEVPVFARF